ncbi:hypothetical protein ACGFZQ_09800 [Streptomyces sp. NPDC048254]|uniref:hypothetical protein n=1 Tax=Streptomyces sp. NPDC048254 TaxID=3365525 RepID=UPI00371F78D1
MRAQVKRAGCAPGVLPLSGRRWLVSVSRRRLSACPEGMRPCWAFGPGGRSIADAVVGDLLGSALEDLQGHLADPVLGGGAGLGEEAPGCAPRVLQHVNEVDQQAYLQPARVALIMDQVQLVPGAADQHHPFPLLVGSRRSASSNTVPKTCAASRSTEAAHHFDCASRDADQRTLT